MELAQRCGAVSAQDRETGGAELAPADQLCAFDRGRHRRAVQVRRAAAVAPRDDGIELLTQLAERIDDGATLLAELEEALIEPAEPVDEGIPVGLELHACEQWEPGGSPEQHGGGAAVALLGRGELARRHAPRDRERERREGGDVGGVVVEHGTSWCCMWAVPAAAHVAARCARAGPGERRLHRRTEV